MAAVGARMKQERERRGITLDDAASATKISTRFLRAMEDEHFEQLPGGIFNKGFIRAYARHLGIDPEEAVADYLELTGAAPAQAAGPDEFPLKPPERTQLKEEGARGLPLSAIAAVLLVIALGFSGWRFYTRQPHLVRGNHSARNGSMSPGSAGQTLPVPGSTETASGTTGTSNSDNANPAGQFTVTINFREDCWVTITADGKAIVDDVVLIAGTKRSFSAQHELVIRAGNVGGVDFEFNGNPLPRQGDLDEVKTLIFDANGLRAAPPPSQAAPQNQNAAPVQPH